MDGNQEIKLAWNEGAEVHRARGIVTEEDDHFVTVRVVNGRLITVAKSAIIKIVRGDGE